MLVASSVAIVVCRCGFKTFNPVSLVNEGVKVTSCLLLTEAVKQPGLTSRYAALRVGEIEVAISGEFGWPSGVIKAVMNVTMYPEVSCIQIAQNSGSFVGEAVSE